MRVSKLFLGLLTAFSVMFFVACSDDDKSSGGIPPNHPIIGVWEYSESSLLKGVYEFRQNGTAEYWNYWDGESNWNYDRTYSVKGNIITLYNKEVYDYKINGNTLTFIYGSDEWYDEFTRVGSGSGIVGTWKITWVNYNYDGGSGEIIKTVEVEFFIEFRSDGTVKMTEIWDGIEEYSMDFTYTASNGKLTTIYEDHSFTYTGGDSFTITYDGMSRTYLRAGTERSRVAFVSSEVKRCENRAKTNLLRSRR